MSKIKIIKLTNGKFIAKRRIFGLYWKVMKGTRTGEYEFSDPEVLCCRVEEYISNNTYSKKPREYYVWKTYEF